MKLGNDLGTSEATIKDLSFLIHIISARDRNVKISSISFSYSFLVHPVALRQEADVLFSE